MLKYQHLICIEVTYTIMIMIAVCHAADSCLLVNKCALNNDKQLNVWFKVVLKLHIQCTSPMNKGVFV